MAYLLSSEFGVDTRMARRTTSSNKTRTARQRAKPESVVEQIPAAIPRRGRKPKVRDVQPAEPSRTDAFFAIGDEPMPVTPNLEREVSAKARRGRKPKNQPASELAINSGDDLQQIVVSAERAAAIDGSGMSGAAAGTVAGLAPQASPAKARRGRPPKTRPILQLPAIPTQQPAPEAAIQAGSADQEQVEAPKPEPSAAKWNQATGTAAFDWPTIERVAAMDGPNQAMARLLLAARAEGANSRWPF